MESEKKIVKHDKITGLFYIENIMSIEEEKELIDNINKNDWMDDLSRRVQHYGYKYDYKKRKIDKNDFLGKLPIWSQKLEDRIFNLIENSEIKIPYKSFDQLIVNEYKSNQGISAHVDCVPCFTDGIFSVTLANHGNMTFKKILGNDSIDIKLKRRSVVILTGDARYKWTHELNKSKNKNFCNTDPRISLTFRKCILN